MAADNQGEKALGAALIGIGRIGRVHLRHLVKNQRVQLLYIVDLNLDIVKPPMKEFGVNEDICKAETLDNLSQVLEDPR